MPSRSSVSNLLLVLAIIAENLFLYFAYRQWGHSQSFTAKGLFLSSLLVGAILLYKFYKRDISISIPSGGKINKFSYALLGIFVLVLIYFSTQYLGIFRANPIGPQYSDIIPEIQVACKRFLSGQNVYTPITDFGYTLELTYLPMQWLPYTFAELGRFDYRWIAFGIWAVAAILLFIRSLRSGNMLQQCLAGVFILLSNYVLFYRNPGIVYSTVELMVAGYYILLIIGLNTRNALVMGLTISVCLLSRFSLLLWLPLGAFTLYAAKRSRQLLWVCVTVAAAVLIIYIIPFLSKDWGSFYRGYKYYDSSALGEWQKVDDKGNPGQVFSGAGFAYIFYYKLANMPIIDRIKLLQKAHLLFSLGVTVLMGTWYWFNRKKIDYRIFLQGSFKIYLTFFLVFIQVPYEYLMMVGNFVSIAIFCEQLRYRSSPMVAPALDKTSKNDRP